VSDLIVENLCDTKYPYRPTPILVSDEAHTIESSVPYSISLKEKPSPDHDIIIPGYTEQDSAPSEATYFYVDYSASLIYFFSSEASESITVTYFGMGSPIIAGDVNRFSLFLDNMKSALFSFLVEALSGSRVRLYGGRFVDSVTGNTINTKKELFIDFGENGNYELGPITAGYSKKVLIGVDVSTLQIAVVEGIEAEKRDAALIPSFASDFRPVAIITVTGDSNGFVLPIVQSDILVVRNFLI
jgi:hypothetical protein